MHQRNTRAIKMHFQGAVAVVQKNGSPYKMDRLAQRILASFACWTSFAPPNTLLIPFAELIWTSSVFPALKKKEDPSVNSAYEVPNPTIDVHNTDDNDDTQSKQPYIQRKFSEPCCLLRQPQDLRNLSPPLFKAGQRITSLSMLARRARNSTLSLQEQAELLAGICCGGQELASLKPSTLSPLEDCIRMTTLIHFFADVVPYEEGDEPRIIHLTAAVERNIACIDLELLLNEWPEVGLWIAIVVGIFAKEEQWSFFQDLLRQFSTRLKPLRWETVTNILNQFQPISSQPFLKSCRAFWLSSLALRSAQFGLGQMGRPTGIAAEIL